MNKLTRIVGLLTLCLGMAIGAQAQKFGYINSQLLLSEMAEVKDMNANLETLQTQLKKKGQAMLTSYQNEEQAAVNKQKRGELSPVEEKTVMENLQKKQKEIVDFEKDMQDKIMQKQQSLLEPILEKVNKAISDVSKENGFQMIFDASSGILLYAEDAQDVTALVKAKLGL